jgi:hypothetical protein
MIPPNLINAVTGKVKSGYGKKKTRDNAPMDKKWCCQEFESHATVIPSEDGFRAVLVGAKLISSRYSSSDRQTNRPLIPRKAE